MKTKKSKHYIYININEKTTALILIADVLGISKYALFLLYETFGNDLFLVFTMFQKANVLTRLSDFKLRRCITHAECLTPVLLNKVQKELKQTELRSYKILNPYLYENKFRIEEDQEVSFDS